MVLIQYLQGDLTQVKHAWTKAAQDGKEPGVFVYQDVVSQNIQEESTTKSHWHPHLTIPPEYSAFGMISFPSGSFAGKIRVVARSITMVNQSI